MKKNAKHFIYFESRNNVESDMASEANPIFCIFHIQKARYTAI